MAEDIYTRLLTQLHSDAAITSLDPQLFQEAQVLLPPYLYDPNNAELQEKKLSLMRLLAADLTDTRRPDHTPIIDLLIRLFDGWTWSQVSEFGTQSIPYKDGLAVGEGMTAFNRLMICLLSKATGSVSEAEQAASMLEAMRALVALWLQGVDVGVSASAGELLYDLLKVDGTKLDRGGVERVGLVWKRVFGDRDVYNVFFESTSLEHGLVSLGKKEKTIAQARLMEWVPKVARLDWGMLSRSHHREVEEKYGVQGGLLDWVALHMVDYNDDVLMHRCLIDFLAELLVATMGLEMRTMAQADSVGLQYLITHGLHIRVAAIYLQTGPVDPVDAMFLYGPAANYLSCYATAYPQHFLASQMAAQVNDRLRQTLDLSPGRWAHSDSPKNDLHLLASLPRQALLPYANSPLALLPCKSTNADVLNTLATVFHGPERQAITFPPTSPLTNTSTAAQSTENEEEEGAAARALYYHYLSTHPRFWQDITTHADTLALLDLALAAIHVMTAVITANWPLTTDPTTHDLPSAQIPTPTSGHLAILSPPALEYALPYLLSPPRTFSHLVGGGRGDTESAAYKVANAKFEAVKALHARLEEQVERTPGEGYEEILGTVGKRVAEGVMGRRGVVEAGSAVGVLEL
jgi:hypothetical protein